MDTKEHVEMWSQVPHNVQKPHSHSYSKLIFQAPQLGLKYKI